MTNEIKDRSIGLTDEAWAAFAEMAREQERSTSSLIRQVLMGYLRESVLSNPDDQMAPPGTPVGTFRLSRPMETRDPSDEEARALREAFPHLKEPKVVDPNARKR